MYEALKEDVVGWKYDQIQDLRSKEMFNKIIEFLRSKNPEYAEIIILKTKGYKNKEICKRLALTEISLKARLQYIRRLIRGEFSQFFANF